MDKIQEILSNVLELKSMPTVFFEVLDNIQDPQVNALRLSNIISKDMALTTQILRLVNSAYYGFSQEITQVNNAIALLGFRTVRNLVMMMALKPMMMTQSGKDLWEHSVRCAYAAQIVSEKISETPSDEVFTVGILHDIGRSLFEIYDKKGFEEVERLSKMGIDKLIIEEDIFGVDHTIVGEAFVIKENLPPLISNAIRYHHDPLNAEAADIAKIIFIAEKLTQPKLVLIEDDFWQKTQIHIENLEELRDEIWEKTSAIIGALK